jgi:hypothetical protein
MLKPGAGLSPIAGLFSRWSNSEIRSEQDDAKLAAFEQILQSRRRDRSHLLAERAQARASAHLSIDTGSPDVLRLTFEPFGDRMFCEIGRKELMELLHSLGCSLLERRVLDLHRLGYALPQRFCLGMAATPTGTITKAYISSTEPTLREWLGALARDAGWLPARYAPSFLLLYEKIFPVFGTLEGIGISFRGDDYLGTTLYFRSCIPFADYLSVEVARYLSLSPVHLPIFRGSSTDLPRAFGWSLESDARGELVDLKMEFESGDKISSIAANCSRVSIDGTPLCALAAAIDAVDLADGPNAKPAVISLRFVEFMLRSVVAYYPVAV